MNCNPLDVKQELRFSILTKCIYSLHIFSQNLCTCVFLWVCSCIHAGMCAWVCAHVCGRQTPISGVFFDWPPLHFLRHGLSLNHESLIHLHWPGSPGVCLHILSTELYSHCHASIFTLVLGIRTQVLMLEQQALHLLNYLPGPSYAPSHFWNSGNVQ